MRAQRRILFIAAIVALAAGWVGLRRGNATLEGRLQGGAKPVAEAAP